MKRTSNKKGQIKKELFLLRKVPKKIKIGLYNPYLDILGGGEKHILSIMDVLVSQGYDLTIFWDKNISSDIFNRFSFKNIKKINWLPSIKTLGTLKTLKTLKNFDYFFYVTDGSYFFSLAKKNFVFCMVPGKKLYNLNLIKKIKLWNYKFISNSPYTTKWLNKWQINPITITPYIDEVFFENKNQKKEKIILSVGRFFSHLHSKNHEKIIITFQKLKKSNSFFKDYKLILAGGLKNEDQDYFKKLKLLAKNDSSVIFKTNISFEELYRIYKLSSYFWHFTGLEINEDKNPEQVEHFGIAPLEAIASGCITFCHNSGGPKEIIENEKTGFLFNDEKELIKKMINIEKNNKLKNQISENGKKMVKNNFNYQIFRNKVINDIIYQQK